LNQITNLDVSNNTALTGLSCDGIQLTTLDVSNNTTLIYLNCAWNQLTNLDVSNNTALTDFICANNQLITLDVSNNTALMQLNCAWNQLTNLDVSNNTALAYFYCYNNQLTNLDVSNNTALRLLYCFNNNLSLFDLFVASEILENNEVNVMSRELGSQTLPSQTVSIGMALVFTAPQNVFNDTYTEYTVTQNGNPAPPSDYTIANGNITFNISGIYTVTMTNEAIISAPDYPARVTFDVTFSTSGIVNGVLPDISVYPNPTNDKFIVDIKNFGTIKLYDILGKEVLSQNANGKTEINISHLSNGIYSVQILSGEKIVGKSKVVKY